MCLLLDDQRRRERDDVARDAHEQSLLECAQEHVEAARPGLARNRLQLDRADQPEIAQVDHVRQTLERVHAVRPVLGELRGARQQTVALIDLLRRDPRGARHRVRRIGVAVEQLDGALGPDMNAS